MKHKTATSVALRQRTLKSGNISLYLDIYTAGRRSYEYLNLYLTGGTSRIDKENDRQTLALAETIRAKRLVELRNARHGLTPANDSDSTLLFDYFDIVANRRKSVEAHSNYQNWVSLRNHLAKYEQRNIALSDIDKRWLEGLKAYLLARLKPTTAHSYFGKFKCLLNAALADGLITTIPKIDGITAKRPERCYLTIEELKTLTATPCHNDIMRRAFLFSCLTGLRWSDVCRLSWENITQNGTFTRLTFAQKKTGEQMYHDINEEAATLLGERGEGRVFVGLPAPQNTNLALKRWALDAGIRKNISFHTARHTFATMLLTVGADIYTVSKLLGHTNIATTQIYAKIVDKTKQEAVNMLPSIL
ncbi:MAG: site-specific integrase [Alistipes sp.]|nr:site-specific integrase [Alistipes sp.]